MIYLDYSATTPVNREVLDTFCKINMDFLGNANSLYDLGINANRLISNSTDQIKKILNIDDVDIIYTSSSTEANNLAIKGIISQYKNRGNHIITTKFEHSSVSKVYEYLKTCGYNISYVDTLENGLIDVNSLEQMVNDKTVLVSINAVNSEIGIKQDIENIAAILKKYPKCFLHVDMTQAIGKVLINLKDVDLFTFSAHKIYGLKGIGCLVKKKNINLEPMIHGGLSTTKYRSGTPPHPLIASLAKSLRLVNENILQNYEYVLYLNKYLRKQLLKYDSVTINSNDKCIPHILNISVNKIKSETLMRFFEQHQIYVSTKSACSDINSRSEAVYYLTKDDDLAKSSIRISLSYLTTKEELDEFIKVFDLINQNRI